MGLVIWGGGNYFSLISSKAKNKQTNKQKTQIHTYLSKVWFLIITNSSFSPVEHFALKVSILTDFMPLSYWILTYILLGSKSSDAKSQGFEIGEGENVLVWH